MEGDDLDLQSTIYMVMYGVYTFAFCFHHIYLVSVLFFHLFKTCGMLHCLCSYVIAGYGL